MHFLVSFTAGIVLHDAQGTRWSYILYTRWSFLGNSFIFPISPRAYLLLYTRISTFTYLWYFTIICKQTNKVIINRIVYYCFVVYLPIYLFIFFLSPLRFCHRGKQLFLVQYHWNFAPMNLMVSYCLMLVEALER